MKDTRIAAMSRTLTQQSDSTGVRERANSHAECACRKLAVRVALVEDQPAVRESWTHLINSLPDFSCVCACGSGEEALRAIPKEQPDAVLMDIFLPRMSGIECTSRLKEILPQTQIVILTSMDDQALVFMALEAGANGYLLKRTKPSELRLALLDVLSGGGPMTSQIARRVVDSFRRKAQSTTTIPRLSAREEQILMLLAEGYANKTIAAKLEVSVDTVRSHVKNVFGKMHVNSRTEAAVRYIASKAQ